MEVDLTEIVGAGQFETVIDIRSIRVDHHGNTLVFGQCDPFWANSETPGQEAVTLQFSRSAHNHDGVTTFLSLNSAGDQTLKIETSSGKPWAQSSGTKIYCNSSIPYPSALLLRVENALEDAFGTYDLLASFGVDLGQTLNSFTTRVKQDSFLLCDSPQKAVYDAICAELDEQQVDYTALASSPKMAPAYRVSINQCRIMCDRIGIHLAAHNTPIERVSAPLAMSA